MLYKIQCLMVEGQFHFKGPISTGKHSLGGFLKQGYPEIIHFSFNSMMFYYKPSIFGYLHSSKPRVLGLITTIRWDICSFNNPLQLQHVITCYNHLQLLNLDIPFRMEKTKTRFPLSPQGPKRIARPRRFRFGCGRFCTSTHNVVTTSATRPCGLRHGHGAKTEIYGWEDP